jgi:hypothetical protein
VLVHRPLDRRGIIIMEEVPLDQITVVCLNLVSKTLTVSPEKSQGVWGNDIKTR